MISINDDLVLSVPVKENHEAFASLLDIPRLYLPSQINTKTDLDDSEIPMVRLTIKEKISYVLELLPMSFGLLLIEGYRSYGYQKQLYTDKVLSLKKEFPALTSNELQKEASKYVSNPDVFSPHVTGGAIDIAIIDEDRNVLDVGNLFEYSESAFTLCEGLTVEQKNNRELLISVMTKAGFVNYPFEWWHWSYGDRYWGIVTGNEAIYDSVKL
jgi:D-alanyl-D-alanine dipeptidase